MASVLNRTTLQFIPSANTPDYPESEWIINPDLSYVEGVDKKYWVLYGDSIREMSDEAKEDKRRQVDMRTMMLIGEGFEFDDTQFSLSASAQMNWTALKSMCDLFEWPCNVSTKDDKEYTLAREDLDAFIDAGRAVIYENLASGRLLKKAINSAETYEMLDLIKDTR